MPIAALYEGKIGAERNTVGTRAPPAAVLAAKKCIIPSSDPHETKGEEEDERGVKPEELAGGVEGPHAEPTQSAGLKGPLAEGGRLSVGPNRPLFGLEGGGPREGEEEGTPPKYRRSWRKKGEEALDLQQQLEMAARAHAFIQAAPLPSASAAVGGGASSSASAGAAGSPAPGGFNFAPTGLQTRAARPFRLSHPPATARHISDQSTRKPPPH